MELNLLVRIMDAFGNNEDQLVPMMIVVVLLMIKVVMMMVMTVNEKITITIPVAFSFCN